MDAAQNQANPIQVSPLHTLLTDAAQRFPSVMALDFLGKKTSYAELGRLVARAAAGFQRLGVKKGTRVALCLPNSPYYVVCYYAILSAGGTVVNLSPLYVERELRYFLSDSGARIVVTLDIAELFEKFTKIVEDGLLDYLVAGAMLDILDPVKKVGFWLTQRKKLARVPSRQGFLRFHEFLASGNIPVQEVPCDPYEDLAVLQYTGGTTGVPKAAMLTHANLMANCIQVRRRLPEIEPGAGMLTLVPLFHVFAMTIALNLSVMLGLEIILLPRYDKRMLRKTLARTKPLFFPGVPTLYANINEAAVKEKWALSSIRYCVSGAAPLPAEIRTHFERISGCQLVEGYGLSEASPVVACNYFGKVRDGSIGLPVDDTIVEIRDMDDPSREVAPGEKGEVCVRGPQVMKGYWNRPDETAKVFVDGLLRTGDVGYRDQDGYIFLVDRIKDLIISGGYNVYPRVVEEVLYKHPAVLEAVVVGIPDAKRGQVPKAYVKLQENVKITEEALQSFLAENLSPLERPKKIEFRDELPKTVVGKISRKELQAENQSGG